MLFKAIERHVEQKADVLLGRYVGPTGQGGLHRLQRLDSGVDFVARGPAHRTWAPGAVLAVGAPLGGPERVILQDPPPGQVGTSAHQVARPQVPRKAGAPLILSLQPGVFQRGESDQSATVFGAGFESHHAVAVTRFDYGAGTDVVDTRFTVHTLDVVSDGHMHFLLDVSSDVPPSTVFDIALVLP